MHNNTIREAFHQASSFLKQKGIADGLFEAEWMLRELLAVDRASFFLMWDKTLTEEQAKKYYQWIQRRGDHEPLQYIFGKADFYGRPFHVTPDVLIPRPETELLVEHVLHKADVLYRDRPIRVVEVGTGSGCIAITLQLERPHWSVTTIDLSADALQIAKDNAKRHGVEDKITFLQGSFLEPVRVETVDVIVSNPPYIPSEVIGTLDQEVQHYEPHLALDGGEDGIYPYRQIISQIAQMPARGKRLIAFEIGDEQGEQVANLVQQLPKSREVEVLQDMSGRDRYVIGLVERG
ncbi:peptide chain release factor N(5)-glutamine methyltransferase [Shimazuella sp. AN120528]|uniref:peptide chain release factor N(5)-glutamine methyltransferase n=1 Tax=Shimazuella soli TaxID=1892854 RepID=UPI001F100298|nr:peptide chain release factor N(5)-glutamine methyltransferase [Shimazuella soli]MCH5585167.1 peptide chain release factor N(5)-glutamine methyltransferase [Shimazuella soli]